MINYQEIAKNQPKISKIEVSKEIFKTLASLLEPILENMINAEVEIIKLGMDFKLN